MGEGLNKMLWIVEKEANFSFYKDMILYIKSYADLAKVFVCSQSFQKVTEYNINMWKLIEFLYSGNEVFEETQKFFCLWH